LSLRELMQSDPQQITAAMKESFVLLQRTQAVHLKTIERLLKELQKVRALLPGQTAQLASLTEALERKREPYFCRIMAVSGDSSVYTLQNSPQLASFADKSIKEVAQWLRSACIAEQAVLLFQGRSGSVDWRLPPD
jgi:hypothetical protein